MTAEMAVYMLCVLHDGDYLHTLGTSVGTCSYGTLGTRSKYVVVPLFGKYMRCLAR